jgi:hypothetical protein
VDHCPGLVAGSTGSRMTRGDPSNRNTEIDLQLPIVAAVGYHFGGVEGDEMRAIGTIVCAGLLVSSANAGPINAERKSEFEKAMNIVIATVAPNLSKTTREIVIREYLESEPNKAQVIEPTEGRPWRSPRHEDLDAAAERALEGCQLRYVKPCALLALNDQIAAEDGFKTKDMPRLHYAGEFDLAKIPTIRPALRARPDIQSYYGTAGPKAIAIHPWGTLFVSVGKTNSKDTQNAALAQCNADPRRNFRDGACFVYAIDNQVVINERRQSGK